MNRDVAHMLRELLTRTRQRRCPHHRPARSLLLSPPPPPPYLPALPYLANWAPHRRASCPRIRCSCSSRAFAPSQNQNPETLRAPGERMHVAIWSTPTPPIERVDRLQHRRRLPLLRRMKWYWWCTHDVRFDSTSFLKGCWILVSVAFARGDKSSALDRVHVSSPPGKSRRSQRKVFSFFLKGLYTVHSWLRLYRKVYVNVMISIGFLIENVVIY